MSGKHTILLLQKTKAASTRTYYDFDTVRLAMDGLCKVFESKLKNQFATQRNITYDINDLYAFIDNLGDLGALVLDPSSASYVPHNKEWVKERLLSHLQHLASQQQ